MAVAEFESGTVTADGTEQTLNTTTPGVTDGVYQLWIGTVNMLKGDKIKIRIKEKIVSAGSSRLVFVASVSHAQDEPAWVSPALILLHGWDMTLQQTAGTNRQYNWSIRTIT
jgi:hypothetical protein